MNDATNYPQISVIIPVYNIAKYLDKCLTSVINQSFSNIEIIVVNDASTDNSLEIISSYKEKDNRIKIINNDENLGISAVRNKGIKVAKGKYIHFVDGDDYLELNAYDKLYNFAENNNLDIILFGHARVRKNKIKNHYFIKKITKYKNKIFLTDNDKSFLLANKIGVTVWNKFYKADFIKNNNLLFIEGMLYEDIPWSWQTIIAAKRISYINDILYYYVKRKTSIMGSKANAKLLDIIPSMYVIYEYLLHNAIVPHYANLFTSKVTKTYLNFYRKIDKQNKKIFYIKMQEYLRKMDLKEFLSKKLKLKLKIYANAPYYIINNISKIKILH
ncbi:glycosyltransferase [Rickettsiales bacterium LUAb2]